MNPLIFFLESGEKENIKICELLYKNNFDVHGFLELSILLKKLETKKPNLIILSSIHSRFNEVEILKRLKSNKEYEYIPVIIINPEASEKEIARGLDMGASDYIIKPYRFIEFIARINANIRKINMYKSKILIFCNLKLDIAKHLFLIDDKIINLTSKEFDILHILIESQSTVVSRGVLLKRIWGYDYLAETRTLDMHIKSLRLKITNHTDKVNIETIRGVGFVIKEIKNNLKNNMY